MKTIYTLALLLCAIIGFSQAPEFINYQGVIRSQNGKPVASTGIDIKFEVMMSNNTSTYTEIHTGVQTNAQGIFNVKIGGGTASVGTFSTIPWQIGSLSLKIGIDSSSANGQSFVDLGGQPIVSVPYALYAPTRELSYNPNTSILVVDGKSQSLAGNGAPTFTVVGNTAGLIGQQPYQALPTPTFVTSVTNSGPVSITGPGPLFTVNSPPTVTLTAGTTYFGVPVPPGLLQVFGSFPNYSLAVTPNISYNGNTGLLSLSAAVPPAYEGNGAPGSGTYTYNITPNLSLSGNNLVVGGNTLPLNPITPWVTNSTAPAASQTVGLANSQASVGIGVNPPLAKLHVNGYTKLGNASPAIQMEKILGLTPAANTNSTIAYPIYITQAKMVSVVVMVDASTGNNKDWIPPGYMTVAGYEYYWRVTNTGVVIELMNGNSSNIVGKEVKILITYEQ